MATFKVPTQFVGKTLQQLRNERSEPFRADLVASMMGVDERTPLTENMQFNVSPDPGSAEYQFISGQFKSWSAQDAADEILNSQKEVIQREIDRAKELFGEDNPFVFDEYLARQSSEAEYEPYYSELLDDYLQDIETQRETVQDETKLLNTLRQLDESEATRSYTRAVARAEEGFEGQGMFFSGIKKRALGEGEVARKGEEERLSEQYGTKEAGLERQLGTIGTAEEQKRRDIFGGDVALGGVEGLGDRVGSYGEAVAGGIEQRRGEGLKQFYTPKLQTYFREFPTSSGSALKGYLPEEYLRY